MHEKRFPPKGKELKDKWAAFEKAQKAAQAKAVEDKDKPAEKKPQEEAKMDAFAVSETKVVKKEEPAKVAEPPKPKSEGVKEMEKISTYNGATTENYSWS